MPKSKPSLASFPCLYPLAPCKPGLCGVGAL
jgi:hypothetical protein